MNFPRYTQKYTPTACAVVGWFSIGLLAVEAARVAAAVAAASGIEVGDAADAKHAAVQQPRSTHWHGHSDAMDRSKWWRGGCG
jgi:hypothetical protein